MADWRSGSRTGGFFYRKVTWPDFREGEAYENATGGSLEMSALSDVKVKGTLQFDGAPPDPDHLIRIYYGFADEEGRYESVPVATMQVQAANPALSEGNEGVNMRGSCALASVLQVLKDDELNAPYTVKAGEQAIAKAMSIIADHGLPANSPDASAYAMSRDYTVPAEEANALHIVNKLLGFAGYASAWVDANGVVQVTPYVEPGDREAVIVFEGGEDSVMYPEVGYGRGGAHGLRDERGPIAQGVRPVPRRALEAPRRDRHGARGRHAGAAPRKPRVNGRFKAVGQQRGNRVRGGALRLHARRTR